MFDQLGAPWPKHDCFNQEYQALKARVLPIIQKGADPRSAMQQPFADLAEKFGLEAQEGTAVVHRDRPSLRKPSKPTKPEVVEHLIKRMDPMPEEEISFVGIIRERGVRTANLKAIYEGLGALGRKAFNLPSPVKAIQLTIVDVEGEPNESYSCLADGGLLDASLKKGVMVWVTIVGKVTPSVETWVIKEIHAV